MKELSTITETLLRELIPAAGDANASISGKSKGFAVVFHIGRTDKTLLTSRGTVRLFASLDTVAAFLRDLGIPTFDVDMTNHKPGRLRKARPDRAEALRRTRTKLHQQYLEFKDSEQSAHV